MCRADDADFSLLMSLTSVDSKLKKGLYCRRLLLILLKVQVVDGDWNKNLIQYSSRYCSIHKPLSR